VVALTDSSGHVVDSYQYHPWGAPTSVAEQVPQRLRYRGYWYDQELGTYWLSVRQYDPALKQFLQADPSQQEGLSAYAYAKSDPVDLADPSGMAAQTWNCGPDMMYCGGLPGGEYDLPPNPQPGDPCYYDIWCYYDGTATAADIAQIDQANAEFIAYGKAQAAEANAEIGALQADGTYMPPPSPCGPDCVDNTGTGGANSATNSTTVDVMSVAAGNATIIGCYVKGQAGPIPQAECLAKGCVPKYYAGSEPDGTFICDGPYFLASHAPPPPTSSIHWTCGQVGTENAVGTILIAMGTWLGLAVSLPESVGAWLVNLLLGSGGTLVGMAAIQGCTGGGS
jgi:RHS repeat-associated protein